MSRNETMILFCTCSISYDGRAQSMLDEGERVILLKSDKTLLVHQKEGNTPVNYMKEGTSHSVKLLDNGCFLLKSKHTEKKEFMDIVISDIHHIHSRVLDDAKKIVLKGTEKDMANMILNNPNLISDDFKPLSMEEHTKHGFIDVFGHDKDNNLVVIECKRYNGDLKAVSQLRRYVEKIKKDRGIEKVRGVLACPRISPNALKMLLSWGFEFKELSPPNYLEQFKAKQKSLREY